MPSAWREGWRCDHCGRISRSQGEREPCPRCGGWSPIWWDEIVFRIHVKPLPRRWWWPWQHVIEVKGEPLIDPHEEAA